MDKIHNFRRGKSGRKIEKLPYERSDGLFSTARKKLMRPAHSIKTDDRQKNLPWQDRNTSATTIGGLFLLSVQSRSASGKAILR